MSWAHTPSQTHWGAPLPGQRSELTSYLRALADMLVALRLWGAHMIPLWSMVMERTLGLAVFWTGGKLPPVQSDDKQL